MLLLSDLRLHLCLGLQRNARDTVAFALYAFRVASCHSLTFNFNVMAMQFNLK